MSETYWQAKIWGLLHDPAFKALHNNHSGRSSNSFWQDLAPMQEWKAKGWNPEDSGKKILNHIHLADYITSASDRGAIGSVSSSVNYSENGLEVAHLLSGEKLVLKIPQHTELLSNRKAYLQAQEARLREVIPQGAQEDIKPLFWWLWRCLPQAACQAFHDQSLMLMPAETRLPDSSIWSHASLTAAMAGALARYNLSTAEIERWSSNQPLSHPYLATFSFSPVQELIKASRKMRDFWAGSWLLHYLSAKVCWQLAQQYGPDCLLYPSLYQQPLIDHWLLQQHPEWHTWIDTPSERSLLTAGFPNVLVLVLPKDKVAAAMQTAKSTLLASWREIGTKVFDQLQDRHWMPQLQPDSRTWQGWLETQWQTYWVGVPIGKEGQELKNAAIPKERDRELQPWLNELNKAYGIVTEAEKLFQETELAFLREAYQQRWEKQGRKFSVNVGAWWSNIFDHTRLALTAVKNARSWQLPTAFGPRSTVSGLGPVVHPGQDWITEGETKKYWQRHAGVFDGREQLNATETLKRGLHLVLPQLLELGKDKIDASYPDLTAGVAGYLKERQDLEHFHQACQAVMGRVRQDNNTIPRALTEAWGIPWIDEHQDNNWRKYHPRLLNAGWLVEDLDVDEALIPQYRRDLQQVIDRYYPVNNPANWYVLAAGDGDGMSEWLKGKRLKNYRHYVPQALDVKQPSFAEFLELPKRMGPSTHNALSRALLDFSNQLLPYLTEQRYAGRLIYGGGDDVLAYTNLWEWDRWLWDTRQCFRGDHDPLQEFNNQGDYWQWQGENSPVAPRPLFTMGHDATISFGIVIAHHSVPLAIALEHLWSAENSAKNHVYLNGEKQAKDAVQVRVLYGNGNSLEATSKFAVFHQWQQLLQFSLEPAIFESAATVWNQHPIPTLAAIPDWTTAFCDRREQLQADDQAQFQQSLALFLRTLWQQTAPESIDREVQNWLKLAAFVLRHRTIIGGQ